MLALATIIGPTLEQHGLLMQQIAGPTSWPLSAWKTRPLLVQPHSAKTALEAHFEVVEGREGRAGVLQLVLHLDLWNNGH